MVGGDRRTREGVPLTTPCNYAEIPTPAPAKMIPTFEKKKKLVPETTFTAQIKKFPSKEKFCRIMSNFLKLRINKSMRRRIFLNIHVIFWSWNILKVWKFLWKFDETFWKVVTKYLKKSVKKYNKMSEILRNFLKIRFLSQLLIYHRKNKLWKNIWVLFQKILKNCEI